ncbi:MAG: hypothetical protein KTR14_07585 [Vampirovibrio sp.]|nr:hypothetical protein [Vampirovibrio sp.]
MHKTLLKFLVAELFEKMARLQLLLDEVPLEKKATAAPLFSELQTQLTEIQTHVLAQKPFLTSLFSDKPTVSGTTVNGDSAHVNAVFQEAIYQPYQRLCQLSEWLNSVAKESTRPELQLFLNDVFPQAFQQKVIQNSVGSDVIGPGVILCRAEGISPLLPAVDLPGITLETLSLIQKNNPLGWLGVLENSLGQLCRHLPSVKTLQEKMKGKLAEEDFFLPVVKHLLALRLLGPAHYYFSIQEALFKEDMVFFEWVEPILFFSLNHLNFVDKNLVILHESIEKSREHLAPYTYGKTGKASKGNEHLFHKDQVTEILYLTEKEIPEKFAFTEKQFQKALQLQERLGLEILLSSSHLYGLDDVRDLLDKKQQETPDISVYDMMSMLGESPNTSREMINAGWIHKVERGPVWLYSTISPLTNEVGENNTDTGMSWLLNMIERRDHLFLKSIETAEVHQMLVSTV